MIKTAGQTNYKKYKNEIIRGHKINIKIQQWINEKIEQSEKIQMKFLLHN